MLEVLAGELLVAVKEVGGVDFDALTGDELCEVMVEFQRVRSAMEAIHARAARSWDAKHAWAADGAKTGRAWLAKRTGAPKQECGSLLWAARETRTIPMAAAAWEAGEITGAHVRRLAKVRNGRTYAAFVRDEELLVHYARVLSFAEFSTAVDYWLAHADPDGADDNGIDQAGRRRVSLDQTIANMWSGSILLDPIRGTIVSTELRRLERQLFEAEWAAAKARLGRDPQLFELARSADQRRADALAEMAERSAGNTTGATAKPLFTVVLGADALRRLCELENTGTAVPPAVLRDWLSEANLETILFDGTKDRVIRVSRQRDFTGALRRLIQVRDRTCYHGYCDERGHNCQVDHIIPWPEGGITSQDNGRLACGFHNRLRNKRPPPDNDPD